MKSVFESCRDAPTSQLDDVLHGESNGKSTPAERALILDGKRKYVRWGWQFRPPVRVGGIVAPGRQRGIMFPDWDLVDRSIGSAGTRKDRASALALVGSIAAAVRGSTGMLASEQRTRGRRANRLPTLPNNAAPWPPGPTMAPRLGDLTRERRSFAVLPKVVGMGSIESSSEKPGLPMEHRTRVASVLALQTNSAARRSAGFPGAVPDFKQTPSARDAITSESPQGRFTSFQAITEDRRRDAATAVSQTAAARVLSMSWPLGGNTNPVAAWTPRTENDQGELLRASTSGPARERMLSRHHNGSGNQVNVVPRRTPQNTGIAAISNPATLNRGKSFDFGAAPGINSSEIGKGFSQRGSGLSDGGAYVSLRGDVVLDSRRVGRIVATGQASGARLPAVSSSAINLRALPVFPGSRVPL